MAGTRPRTRTRVQLCRHFASTPTRSPNTITHIGICRLLQYFCENAAVPAHPANKHKYIKCLLPCALSSVASSHAAASSTPFRTNNTPTQWFVQHIQIPIDARLPCLSTRHVLTTCLAGPNSRAAPPKRKVRQGAGGSHGQVRRPDQEAHQGDAQVSHLARLDRLVSLFLPLLFPTSCARLLIKNEHVSSHCAECHCAHSPPFHSPAAWIVSLVTLRWTHPLFTTTSLGTVGISTNTARRPRFRRLRRPAIRGPVPHVRIDRPE